MKNDFKGVMWTNHALARMRERGISQGDAWVTFNRPEDSREQSNKSGQKTKGAWVYYRTYGDQRIEVVAKKNEEGKWVVLSVWSKQIQPGMDYGGANKDSFFIKVLKKIVGVK